MVLEKFSGNPQTWFDFSHAPYLDTEKEEENRRRRRGGGRDEGDTSLSGALKKNLASAQSVMMMGETEKLRGEGKGKRALITTG